jgi:hypothetical protein
MHGSPTFKYSGEVEKKVKCRPTSALQTGQTGEQTCHVALLVLVKNPKCGSFQNKILVLGWLLPIQIYRQTLRHCFSIQSTSPLRLKMVVQSGGLGKSKRQFCIECAHPLKEPLECFQAHSAESSKLFSKTFGLAARKPIKLWNWGWPTWRLDQILRRRKLCTEPSTRNKEVRAGVHPPTMCPKLQTNIVIKIDFLCWC